MNLNQSTKRLGDLITLFGGGTPTKDIPEYWDGDIPWASVKDLKGSVLNSTIDSISELGLNNSSSKMVPSGNIVIATRMAVGRTVITEIDVAINQDLKAIICSDKLNKNFLYYFLLSQEAHFNNVSTGATVKGIKINHITDIMIPDTPLSEQKRISDILNAADSLRSKDQQLVDHYNSLSQSLFLDMFGDPVVNPLGWETRTIEELVHKRKGAIKRGPFGGALKKDIFVDEGYLIYEQYHALNNDFSKERYFIDEDKFNELKAFEVKAGDLIISCSGVYLGKLAIIPKNAKRGIINQALLRLTLDNSTMVNDIFIYIFTNKKFKNKYYGVQRGSGVPNFPPISEFKKYNFICPPISLQNEFVERLRLIDKQKKHAQASLQKSKDLFNSLLQRAFKGELTS